MQFKTLISLSLIASACFSVTAFAGTGREAGKAHCYVFKNDKLSKKAICNYDYYEGSNAEESTESIDFVVPGYGKIGFVNSATVDDNASDGKNSTNASGIEVNKKPAIYQIRDMKSYKVLAVDKVPENITAKYLECYKQKKTNLEICYDPNFISSHSHN